MITKDQIQNVYNSLHVHGLTENFLKGDLHSVKSVLCEYEESKWNKFDPNDKSTWPCTYETYHSYIDQNAIVSDPVMTDKGLAVFVNEQWRSIGWAGDKNDRIIHNVTKWCYLPN